jgi:hypothetical protein
MREYLLELVAKRSGYNERLNIMREYLQAYILHLMHDAGAFRRIAFVGGTALRFLHGLPRFSEDLDFSAASAVPADFAGMLKKIKAGLGLAGYQVVIAYDDQKTVLSAFVKFQGLLQAAGITGHEEQVLSIKLEIDSNPPAGAGLETRLVNKYFPVAFQSYDTPSLFAGKLHCVYTREYLKGRDYFDIGWYLSKWPDLKPNLVMLGNALKQTGWEGASPGEDTWRKMLYEKIAAANWEKVRRDVENFLENSADRDIFTKENVLGLVKARPYG